MNLHLRTIISLPIITALLFFNCSKVEKKVEDVKKEYDTAKKNTEMKKDTGTSSANNKFVCVLSPTKGNNVKGTLMIYKDGKNVRIEGEITGLTPGKHGMHIHEKGDCSAPDASTAGDHYNPMHKVHGDADDKDSHMGDLGNIKADDKGVAKVDIKVDEELMALDGPNSILGKGFIVHAGEDDLKTQPSGNSGPRVACGKIEKSQ